MPSADWAAPSAHGPVDAHVVLPPPVVAAVFAFQIRERFDTLDTGSLEEHRGARR